MNRPSPPCPHRGRRASPACSSPPGVPPRPGGPAPPSAADRRATAASPSGLRAPGRRGGPRGEARLPVPEDLGGAAPGRGDDGKPRGHRLEAGVAERLVDRPGRRRRPPQEEVVGPATGPVKRSRPEAGPADRTYADGCPLAGQDDPERVAPPPRQKPRGARDRPDPLPGEPRPDEEEDRLPVRYPEPLPEAAPRVGLPVEGKTARCRSRCGPRGSFPGEVRTGGRSPPPQARIGDDERSAGRRTSPARGGDRRG